MAKAALVTRSQIRALCGNTYFQRGRRYYEEGRVISLFQDTKDPARWTTEVRGSQMYEVALSIGKDIHAHCPCGARDAFHYCKHVAAALIAIGAYSKSNAYLPVDTDLANAEPPDAGLQNNGTSESRPAYSANDPMEFSDTWTDPWDDANYGNDDNNEDSEQNADNNHANHGGTQPVVTPSTSGTSTNQSRQRADATSGHLDSVRPDFTVSERILQLFHQPHKGMGMERDTLGYVPYGHSDPAQSDARPAHSGPGHFVADVHSARSGDFVSSPVPSGSKGHGAGLPPLVSPVEQREWLQFEYVCRPVTSRFGVAEHINLEIKAGPQKPYIVKKIRPFLEAVESGTGFPLTSKFTYHPDLYRLRSTDLEILRILFEVVREEALYNGLMGHYHTYSRQTGERALFITPFIWRTLSPLLEQSYTVVEGTDLPGPYQVLGDPPPIYVQLGRSYQGTYTMEVTGISQMIALPSYGCVVAGSTFHRMDPKALRQFVELQRIVDQHRITEWDHDSSGHRHGGRRREVPAWQRIENAINSVKRQSEEPVARIPIAEDALEQFINEVVPGLKRVGRVEVDHSIGQRIIELPLHTKLYLDRYTHQAPYYDEDVLSARLLFVYGDTHIDPLKAAFLPEERRIVVRDLQQEARILQYLEQSGFVQSEGELMLVGEHLVFEFLFERLPELEQWVEVLATSSVDGWVQQIPVRPKSRIEIDSKTNWLEVSFEMGDLSSSEIVQVLQSMIERKKYHRLQSGAFMSLVTPEFSELRHILEELSIRPTELKKTRRRPSEDKHGDTPLLLQMQTIRALPLLGTDTTLSSVRLGRALRQWLDDLRNPDNVDAKIPQGLNATLREYQKFGYQWMKTLAQHGFGGILADDMGLGKTIQAITFLLSEPAVTLIVCPASLTYNWKSEINRFAPALTVVVVTGDRSEREAALGQPADVIITSYPLLWRDVELYRGRTFRTLILDEAQAIKNYASQTAQAVAEIQSTNRFALTGTPVENSLDDLWSIFHAVFPTLLGNRTFFGTLSAEVVAERIRPFILRRLKQDVLTELPEKIETLQTAELTKEQKVVYMAYLTQLQADTLKDLSVDGFQKGRFHILAGLTRLRQICCHPALCIDNFRGNSGKLEQLLELVEEYLSANQRMLIFSQFTSMLRIIRTELTAKGFPHLYLDGQTPAKERLALCDRFNHGEAPIFLISLKAGGTGLNLTGADTVILYDLWWNPAVEEQAADRAHRIGQKNTVQVVRMVTQGTIEEKMYQLQQKKRHLIDTVVQASDEGLSALTEEDVRQLLNLDH